MESKLQPRAARTERQVAELPFDNVYLPSGFSAMVEPGTVIVWGDEGEGRITIPREAFDALVDWYNNGNIPKSETREASEGIEP